MYKGLKILIGLIFVVVPLALILPGMPLNSWGEATWELIKGGITLLVILFGLVLIVLGIGELRD